MTNEFNRAPKQEPLPELMQTLKQSTLVKPQAPTLGTDVKVAQPQPQPPKLLPAKPPVPMREPSTRVRKKLKQFEDECSKIGFSKSEVYDLKGS